MQHHGHSNACTAHGKHLPTVETFFCHVCDTLFLEDAINFEAGAVQSYTRCLHVYAGPQQCVDKYSDALMFGIAMC